MTLLIHFTKAREVDPFSGLTPEQIPIYKPTFSATANSFPTSCDECIALYACIRIGLIFYPTMNIQQKRCLLHEAM